MSQGGSGKGKNVAHNKLSVEEAFNELNKPEGSITLDEAVAELPYTSEAIQNYPVYTPTWHQPNLTDNDLAESADRIMRLLELAMNMISNKAFLDDGLTLMYALGRNFSLVKKGTTWEYIFRDSMLSGPRFKTEHDSTFDNMWEASVTSDKLKDYIEKTYSSLTIQGAGYFRSVGNNTPPIHKIAYCGMFSCLMLRSIVKDKMSLGYLYAVKEKQQNKLEQFFVAFYGAVPPYSIRVHDSVLFHANIQTPNNKEARSLMFHGFLLFEDREKHKDSLRVLGACFIQTLMNFGLPAVTWAMKAARVGRLGDLKTFLGAIATQDLETSIANIVSYSKFYVTATGDKLHYVARILNSDYFKSLGREPNDTLIISCYLICYVNASEEERKRLIRYNAPQDPTLYGRAFLYQYLKHIRTKSIQKSTRSSNSIMNTSKPLEINEKKLEKEVDELYGEAMKRVLQRAEAEKEGKIDDDDEEDESESEGEGSDRDEKEEDDGNEKDGKEEDVEL